MGELKRTEMRLTWQSTQNCAVWVWWPMKRFMSTISQTSIKEALTTSHIKPVFLVRQTMGPNLCCDVECDWYFRWLWRKLWCINLWKQLEFTACRLWLFRESLKENLFFSDIVLSMKFWKINCRKYMLSLSNALHLTSSRVKKNKFIQDNSQSFNRCSQKFEFVSNHGFIGRLQSPSGYSQANQNTTLSTSIAYLNSNLLIDVISIKACSVIFCVSFIPKVWWVSECGPKDCTRKGEGSSSWTSKNDGFDEQVARSDYTDLLVSFYPTRNRERGRFMSSVMTKMNHAWHQINYSQAIWYRIPTIVKESSTTSVSQRLISRMRMTISNSENHPPFVSR